MQVNTSNKLNELSMTNDVWGTYSENESSVSGRSNGDVVMIALDVDNKKHYGMEQMEHGLTLVTLQLMMVTGHNHGHLIQILFTLLLAVII